MATPTDVTSGLITLIALVMLITLVGSLISLLKEMRK